MAFRALSPRFRTIAFYGGVSFFVGGLLSYAVDYRNKSMQNYEKQVEIQKLYIQKRNVHRYTNKELTEVVHNLPPNQWTNEQVQELDRRYLDRARQYHADRVEYWKIKEEYARSHKLGALWVLSDFPPTPCTDKGYDEAYKRFESSEIEEKTEIE